MEDGSARVEGRRRIWEEETYQLEQPARLLLMNGCMWERSLVVGVVFWIDHASYRSELAITRI